MCNCPECLGYGFHEVQPAPQNDEDIRVHGVAEPEHSGCTMCGGAGEVSERVRDAYDRRQEAAANEEVPF